MAKLNVKQDWHEQVLPLLKAGVTVKVHQIIKEKNTKGEEKQRVQIFEGIILGRHGGQGKSATITVRKVASGGIGVERIFPIWSPAISKIEATKIAEVRRAKLSYIKGYKKKLSEKQVK
ncbi:MAG: 50S ribosomal protein L19 [Patescibacteria group bacterium]|jgi:large subunit ribosomal protein L19